MRRLFFLVLLLQATGAAPGLAQAATETLASVSENAPRSVGRRSPLRIALYSVGGAIVGAWAGYVASQVAWSDWRDKPGRDAQRLRFSLAGAGVGFVGGFMIGRRRPPAPRPVPARMPPDSREEPITEQEIRASSARSLPELLREKRPAWLRSRGVDVLTPRRDPVRADGVRVYLNGGLLGGLNELDEVSIDVVTRVEFFDAEAAVLRWGAGNEDGAILLMTGASE